MYGIVHKEKKLCSVSLATACEECASPRVSKGERFGGGTNVFRETRRTANDCHSSIPPLLTRVDVQKALFTARERDGNAFGRDVFLSDDTSGDLYFATERAVNVDGNRVKTLFIWYTDLNGSAQDHFFAFGDDNIRHAAGCKGTRVTLDQNPNK